MNYTDKLKLAKEALESGSYDKETIKYIFPELEESKDEKIRKAIKLMYSFLPNEPTYIGTVPVKDIFAWLEKQGEKKSIDDLTQQEAMDIAVAKCFEQNEQKPYGQRQECVDCQFNYAGECKGSCVMKRGEQKPTIEMKSAEESLGIDSDTYNKIVDECIYGEQTPTDKAEPKFKVGDWVIDKQGIVHQIANVIENVTYHTYGYDIVGGGYFNDDTEGVRLWTIQDAKDGDVLHCWIDGYEFVLIYKGIKDGYITTYGHLYQNLKSFSEEPTTMFCRTIQGHFTPATKEQRDTLERAITNAGYEWDVEKKELKKIEQKPVEWSDEDIETLERIISNYEYFCDTLTSKENWSETEKEACKKVDYEDILWLKSLKNICLPQPKQEWSEEDKRNLQGIIDEIEANKNQAPDYDLATYDRFLSWLKSIRPQKQWKPSEEQMVALSDINVTGCISYAGQGQELINLYNDLKKLKG